MVMEDLPSCVVCVCLAILSWTVVSANNCQLISGGRVYEHNNICYAFMNNEMKWVDAERRCREIRADMVHIEDEATMQFLKTVMNDELMWTNNGVWIGLNNRNHNGWKWTTGEGQAYRYWVPGNPRKTLGLVSLKTCVVMRRSYDWRWQNYFCDHVFYKYKFICQFDMPTWTSPVAVGSTPTTTTSTGECFKCRNSAKCLDMRWVCDWVNDCGDNSDEENCEMTCKPKDFQCLSKHCIPEEWKCDGDRDCEDGSDESPDICPVTTTTPMPPMCSKYQFRCNNGRCLSSRTRCNGIYDCLDFSDEHNCTVCTGITIMCKNTNRCINPSWICDGTDDCGDNWDEENCGSSPVMPLTDIGTRPSLTTTTAVTPSTTFSITNCQPISDMISTNGHVARHSDICYAFMNNKMKWVDAERRCKEIGADMVHIPDEATMQFLKTVMNDELMWTSSYVWIGLHNRNHTGWKWTNGDKQTYRNWIVGYPSKTLGLVSLENCAAMRRTYDWKWADYFCDNIFYRNKFICQFRITPTTTIIPTTTATTSQPFTTTGMTSACSMDQFRCNTGKCLSKDTRCDGIYDCFDFSDEHHCSVCTGSAIKCKDRNRCIKQSWICDGADDCGDNWDEENCDTSLPSTVTPSTTAFEICEQFQCENLKCINLSNICNHVDDCGDYSDEVFCDYRTTTTSSPLCNMYQFRCNNGHCLSRDKRCNAIYDCLDFSDEHHCSVCTGSAIKCKNTNRCINPPWICDGADDCGDNWDEENCGSTTSLPRTDIGTRSSIVTNTPAVSTTSLYCKINEFQCANGMCIPVSEYCNGWNDCYDNSDEDNCEQCTDSEWSCLNGRQCILLHWRCDGEDDCIDGTDEYNCISTSYNPTTTTTASSVSPTATTTFVIPPAVTTTTITPPISSTSSPATCFKCKTTDFCISTDYVCDGDQDCDDNSDENNCGYYDLVQAILDERNRIRQLFRMSKEELLDFVQNSKGAAELSMFGVLPTESMEDALVSALMSLYADVLVV